MNQRMIRLMLLKLCVCLVAASLLSCNSQPRSAIRIGVIHSLTGTMAMSEAPLADAVLPVAEAERRRRFTRPAVGNAASR